MLDNTNIYIKIKYMKYNKDKSLLILDKIDIKLNNNNINILLLFNRLYLPIETKKIVSAIGAIKEILNVDPNIFTLYKSMPKLRKVINDKIGSIFLMV